ncbi:MAG TPA: 6-phosphofructokinase [Oscillospiraceae bacterium]|jgi:6-phosphofructokinase 1|nr:6-phosphofructokinase [Oscillospiraceae bacterium]HRW56446.1 6-phosphofructokinase [Oscillospiraceae bacterium]
MSELRGACLIGQSGGPTSVINSSAYGMIKTALETRCITRVLAARHGIKGVLDDDVVDMGKEDPAELELFLNTPSSLIGSCRYKMKNAEEDDTDYRRILEIFKKYDVRYFFYNGGNDSMDTCNKISEYMQGSGWECRVIGVPKTIDNDLVCTDHCPGFGSAAKYIATSVAEVIRDAEVYDKETLVVVETMGRHAGWLAAASSLASVSGRGPALVYLPEVTFDLETFFRDVDAYRREHLHTVIVASEGIHDGDGRFISEYGSDLAKNIDSFGHRQLGGLAATLAQFLHDHTGAKVRGIEFSLLQRCSAHCASGTDIQEAFLAGKAAVEAAVAGATGKMVAFERPESGEYRCITKLIDLTDVANAEKSVPREWINEGGNGMLQPYFDYALPLIQGAPENKTENGMPKYPKMKWIHA